MRSAVRTTKCSTASRGVCRERPVTSKPVTSKDVLPLVPANPLILSDPLSARANRSATFGSRHLVLYPRPQYIPATRCRPVLTDIRRGFEFPRTIEPACRLILQKRAG